MRRVLLAAGVAAATLLAAGCASSATGASNSGSGPVVLRLGFLANITHEPALVGLAKGYFTKNLGKNVELKTTIFSSGTEGDDGDPGRPARRGLCRAQSGDQRVAEVPRHGHQDHLRR